MTNLNPLFQLAHDRQGVCDKLAIVERDHTEPQSKRNALYQELHRLDGDIYRAYQEAGRPGDKQVIAGWKEFRDWLGQEPPPPMDMAGIEGMDT